MSRILRKNRTSFVDPDTCTGCEACVAISPGVFRMNSLGLSEVHNCDGDSEEKIQEAMDGCPVDCIHWEK